MKTLPSPSGRPPVSETEGRTDRPTAAAACRAPRQSLGVLLGCSDSAVQCLPRPVVLDGRALCRLSARDEYVGPKGNTYTSYCYDCCCLLCVRVPSIPLAAREQCMHAACGPGAPPSTPRPVSQRMPRAPTSRRRRRPVPSDRSVVSPHTPHARRRRWKKSRKAGRAAPLAF